MSPPPLLMKHKMIYELYTAIAKKIVELSNSNLQNIYAHYIAYVNNKPAKCIFKIIKCV